MLVSGYSLKELVAATELAYAVTNVPVALVDSGVHRYAAAREGMGDTTDLFPIFEICQRYSAEIEASGADAILDRLQVRPGTPLFHYFLKRLPWIRALYLVPVRTLRYAQGVSAWMCLLSDRHTALSSAQMQSLEHCLALLQSTHDPMQSLLPNFPELFCVCDFEGKFCDFNQSFIESLGYCREELNNKLLYELVHPDDFAVTQKTVETLAGGESVKLFRNRYRHKNGYYRLFEWSFGSDCQSRLIFASARDITAQAQSELAINESNKMLSLVSEALAEHIRSGASVNPFDVMLSHLLGISDSEYGFIGEVLRNADGEPYLQTHALTNIAWDEGTRRLYDENIETGLKFNNLQTLFGHVMTSGRAVISNQPAADPRSGGLPAGHPALNAFMGLPIYSGSELIGMAGIANRPAGYDEDVAIDLELLIATCSNLILAFRAERARQLAQQELVRSEEAFRALVDNAADGIFQMDQHGCIKKVNPAMQTMFGLSAAALMSMSADRLFDSGSQSEFWQMLSVQNLLRTDSSGMRKELVAQRANADLFQVDITLSRMLDSDSPHFVAIVRDVSAWKKIREELLMATIQAEAGNKAKGEFLANMSHEVRTPINGVIGMTELALGTELDDEQREYLEIINESALSLLRVINDILDFSKIDAGLLSLEMAPFDIRKSLALVMRDLSLQAQQKGLSFIFKIDNRVPSVLVGDLLRLRQVLINLIFNAVKFTNEGQVGVGITLQSVSEKSVRLLIAVEDTGIGIAPEQIEAIFKAFSQADTSITRKYGGSGLGLVISSNLVALMGGVIRLDSELGKGSKFAFELDLDIGTHKDLETVKQLKSQFKRMPASQSQIGKIHSLNVLLAEDNPVNQKLTATLLTKAGHSVALANNGLEAVEMFKAQIFDLILMDLQMPEMDGMQATAVIRQLESDSGHRTPIIAVTAHAMIGFEEMCMANGMDAYISKPVSPADLFRLVDSFT